MNRFKKRLKSDKGATMIQYCLLLSMLALAGLPGLYYMQQSVNHSGFGNRMLLLYIGGGSKGS